MKSIMDVDEGTPNGECVAATVVGGSSSAAGNG